MEDLKDLCKCSPLELRSLALQIITDYASTEGMIKLSAQGGRCDDLLYQLIQMARDLLDYILFNWAISYGDIELLEDLLPRLLFWYIGGGSSNYSIKILELLQGLCREWPTDLKCVFSNSFILHTDPFKELHPLKLLASEHDRHAIMLSAY